MKRPMRLIDRLLAMSQLQKQFVVLAVDMALALIATWLAYSLRLERYHYPYNGEQLAVYGITAVLFVPIFIRFGLYRAIFRYSGIASLRAVAQAVCLYGLILFSLLVALRLPGVPRSLGIMQPLLFWGFVSFSRIVASQLLLKHLNLVETARRPTMIYGAGNAGAQAASSLTMSGQSLIVGFLDDDAAKQGKRLNGLKVHAPSDIPRLIERHGVTDILLALPGAPLARRRAIVASLEPFNIRVRSIPEFSKLAIGQATFSDMEDLRIDELLERQPLAEPIDARTMGLRTVLVTGAGGSIGSELCRQLLATGIDHLVMVDHNEFGLYRIHAEISELITRNELASAVTAHLASVRDRSRMDDIVRLHRPDALYHAAAYKHVPLIENDPLEGVTNNIIGTMNTADVARANGVGRFVLISTDKAVRPTNVMGATKRMAEMTVQALADETTGTGGTVFSMVRFGNVLDSSGSVVPLFRRQIREGGPITVTDPDVTRYFMTIPEAVSLVLQAGQMATGGEVFVLDMGEPVKIINLARRMIRLSGRTERTDDNPGGDIEISTIGLRPGEKLYEELLIGENPLPTANPSILKAHEKFLAWETLKSVLDRLAAAAECNDEAACAAILSEHVSGYVRTGPCTDAASKAAQ
ncbi:nucleoside-diphosphate sugar epimerase/dehydratase [Pararhizobium haloflavum]|uniref:nucleoside-diphosphate sugar epimerase/dehydratase n=1 Tax=Pararhizobium haloflavum TaxID=2037914 RepID=UPI0018E442FE|nr:nucleoside-diphosphate sugar epimerase/dehydratase [Pararhizobium haloflavum]